MNAHESTLVFHQPGPGGWKSLADHFPGALTPEYQRLYAETCPPGMASYMSRYGVLARSLDIAFVHGHVYITPVPIAGPREIRRTPPMAAVWLMARVHPEFRRRTRAAQRALNERPWRQVADQWFEAERAQWVKRAQRMQDIDPATLETERLAEHVLACRALVAAGYERHFELHGDDLLPIGLLMARCSEWGIEPATALRALDRVPSPIPQGDPPAWQLATGYDLDGLTWHELDRQAGVMQQSDSGPVFDLRELVPSDDHGELDLLVSDARAAVPLRDDNGMIIGAWPMGLLRRAMLEAGRRLGLENPSVAVEATVDELVGRLGGSSVPSNDELIERQADRVRRSRLDAPTSLGPEFAIPPLDALPRALARIGAAQLAVADHMLAGSAPIGVGTEAHTGRALVVDDPSVALSLIRPGDVVITQCTSPAWNSILALAGALVTTTGGLVSHAAVIARELDIPAVIGDAGAYDRFTTGWTVTVDPVTATVEASSKAATRSVSS